MLTLAKIEEIMYEEQIKMEADVGGVALDAFERLTLQGKQAKAIFEAQRED